MREPRWFRRVQVGSVIAERSGRWRVVRAVHRGPSGKLWGVSLVIRRCSWTHRCYTVLTHTDLKYRGFRLIRVPPRTLRTELDRKIQACLGARDKALTCCDVEGVA